MVGVRRRVGPWGCGEGEPRGVRRYFLRFLGTSSKEGKDP